MYSGRPAVRLAFVTRSPFRRRALALVGLSAMAAPAFAQNPARVAVRLEAGPEFDSNPARLEAIQGAAPPHISSSALVRTVGTADIVLPVSARQILAATASAGGKLFLDQTARPEDVAVAQATALWSLAFSDQTGLSLSTSYYEAFARGGSKKCRCWPRLGLARIGRRRIKVFTPPPSGGRLGWGQPRYGL